MLSFVKITCLVLLMFMSKLQLRIMCCTVFIMVIKSGLKCRSSYRSRLCRHLLKELRFTATLIRCIGYATPSNHKIRHYFASRGGLVNIVRLLPVTHGVLSYVTTGQRVSCCKGWINAIFLSCCTQSFPWLGGRTPTLLGSLVMNPMVEINPFKGSQHSRWRQKHMQFRKHCVSIPKEIRAFYEQCEFETENQDPKGKWSEVKRSVQWDEVGRSGMKRSEGGWSEVKWDEVELTRHMRGEVVPI
jgi:hypothetical protein